MYDIYDDKANPDHPTVQSNYGWVDSDGDFRLSPYAYRQTQTLISPR